MVALSIKLPEHLAESSRQIAQKLGITRSELIRRALVHEIQEVEAHLERKAMAEAFRIMAQRVHAARDSEALDHALDEPLPEETDGWWNG